jgi:hypothetical protein
MIAPSLFAFLRSIGVELSADGTPKDAPAGEPTRLRLRSPVVLSDELKDVLAAHRDELLQFVVELEERAAIIEADQGCAGDEAFELARRVVLGGTAGPDGRAWLRDVVARTPLYQNCSQLFDGLEDVSLIREAEAA